MLSSEVDFKNLFVSFHKIMHLFYLAHTRTFSVPFTMQYLFLAVKNTTISEPENPTRAISRVLYISLGITSAFLLLSEAVVVWCYRRKKLKTIERFVCLSIC